MIARVGGLIIMLAGLHAGDPATAPVAATPSAASGYSFTVGQTLWYLYEMKQDVEFASAGDRLAYTSVLAWQMSLRPVAVTPQRVELNATILRVAASHAGPGTSAAFDSTKPDGRDGRDDPLLGHLAALVGATLGVTLDPRSGAVEEVRGGDEIVRRINARAPSAFPGAAPPLDAQARAAYSTSALTRLWNGLLELPPSGGGVQAVALGPPLSGACERRWSGDGYVLAPSGSAPIALRLAGDPTPVDGTLTALAGKGSIALAGGVPASASGELSFTLTLAALTQPVEQRHALTWRLVPTPP